MTRAPAAYSFSGFVLDLTRGSLLAGTEEVKLRPKSYKTLRYLVEHAGQLVPKSELLAVLWPSAISVSDDSLTHCIMDVRRALGDDGQRFIRTVPGRGYRFDCAVQTVLSPNLVVTENKPAERSRRSGIWKRIAVGVGALLVSAAILILVKNERNRRWATQAAEEVEKLAAARQYAEAYNLALRVLTYLPSEPRVARLMNEVSDELSVSTVPPGAEVYLRRMGATQAELLGVSPVEPTRIARDEYVLTVRKAGFAPFARTVSSSIGRATPTSRKPWEIRIGVQLNLSSQTPPEMTAAPGGDYRLQSYARPSSATVNLKPYFIDRFEVSNSDFHSFVQAGGYTKPAYWEPEAEQLREALRDKTGLPGPRGWVGGRYPAGRERHPVTGVTWHEALAYCRSRGKNLPTLFQWEKAARGSIPWTPQGLIYPWGLFDPKTVAKRANFDSAGSTPVDSFEFGMSPIGAYQMAGNVAEWIRNAYDDGRTIAGGSWDQPAYLFGTYSGRSARFTSESLGFRCAVAPGSGAGDPDAIAFTSERPQPSLPVSSDREFQAAAMGYQYEAAPLQASVVAVRDTGEWRREEIAFNGFGGERATAFLYLPKRTMAPYQAIHYLSGAGWFSGIPVTEVVETSDRMSPFLRAGRAVFLVVLKGFAGREPVGSYSEFEMGSQRHREALKSWAIDMRRGVDYLQTRTDIDPRKIAFWNVSTVEFGAVIAALDPRYASVILVGAGSAAEWRNLVPEVNPLHFAPHIRAPKLLLNGRYDDGAADRPVAPLFRLLREPKKSVYFDGGHIPPSEIAVPVVNAWLDQTLGPVSRR